MHPKKWTTWEQEYMLVWTTAAARLNFVLKARMAAPYAVVTDALGKMRVPGPQPG